MAPPGMNPASPSTTALFGPPARPASAPEASYRVDRREFAFLLWEQQRLEADFLGRAPYAELNRDGVEALLDRAQAFAGRLAAANREADRQPAHRAPDGRVVVPPSFPALWAEFRRDWSWIRRLGEQ